MRSVLLASATIAAFLLAGGNVQAGDCSCAAVASHDGCGHGGHGGCGCGLFGHHGCGLFGDGGRRIDGLDPSFNCGCRGSYNYPVPPQYTYHWPGMYKQARMTDYVSPWRFPPLKPYVDEVPMAEVWSEQELLPVSATFEAAPALSSGDVESVSSRLERASR